MARFRGGALCKTHVCYAPIPLISTKHKPLRSKDVTRQLLKNSMKDPSTCSHAFNPPFGISLTHFDLTGVIKESVRWRSSWLSSNSSTFSSRLSECPSG